MVTLCDCFGFAAKKRRFEELRLYNIASKITGDLLCRTHVCPLNESLILLSPLEIRKFIDRNPM